MESRENHGFDDAKMFRHLTENVDLNVELNDCEMCCGLLSMSHFQIDNYIHEWVSWKWLASFGPFSPVDMSAGNILVLRNKSNKS